MRLLLLFIAIPLIEIALFVQVGGAIGLWWTLAIVLITAVIGTSLVRTQGALALNDLRNSFNEMRDPSEPLANGAMILFSGALLLTPGFFTDAIGFALLIPAVRRAVFGYVRSRVKVVNVSGANARPPHDPGVIDGDYEEVETPVQPTHRPEPGPSGWTRH